MRLLFIELIKITLHHNPRNKIDLELYGLQDFVLPESQVQGRDGGAAAQDRGVAVKQRNVIAVNLFQIKSSLTR